MGEPQMLPSVLTGEVRRKHLGSVIVPCASFCILVTASGQREPRVAQNGLENMTIAVGVMGWYLNVGRLDL